jgi:hypothetical protein
VDGQLEFYASVRQGPDQRIQIGSLKDEMHALSAGMVAFPRLSAKDRNPNRTRSNSQQLELGAFLEDFEFQLPRVEFAGRC